MPQTWMITGANRGIGLALTTALAARGDHVVPRPRSGKPWVAALAEVWRARRLRRSPSM